MYIDTWDLMWRTIYLYALVIYDNIFLLFNFAQELYTTPFSTISLRSP